MEARHSSDQREWNRQQRRILDIKWGALTRFNLRHGAIIICWCLSIYPGIYFREISFRFLSDLIHLCFGPLSVQWPVYRSHIALKSP